MRCVQAYTAPVPRIAADSASRAEILLGFWEAAAAQMDGLSPIQGPFRNGRCAMGKQCSRARMTAICAFHFYLLQLGHELPLVTSLRPEKRVSTLQNRSTSRVR